ncbi:MAG: hypothetical protein A3C02_04360 [Candidatus Andersenbacteria bacterium RIFCSPHIGHO2_02_FULL_45_11]|uniref:Uncharacterized protein n=1 Tax=Candidatus Andersenbacteria bacterium RIFCSPHIGHO2_12_FULL_45_11 TaxID=1797281 RepID=A0A1G1X0B7_9BACT|nr:MAG: hypothetical protein A3C02_04360 [Candidatus Andersenbacteria bacterium RIFCSPHIGHO2_02_FULL_45_11]OGY33449.1 MAG: hypothetical protein A3D99_04890 [Candidatus Andersenbacteria bacterium RIFCSPHIGHO2_12_FULL_45_11]
MIAVRKIVLALAASKIIAQRQLAQRARNVGIGIGLCIIGGLLGLLGIVGGIFSIFFALANVQEFIYPSLIAGGISLLIALLIGIEGKRMLKGK